MNQVAAAYRGPHRVVLRRNKINSGLANHVNAVIELSHGKVIIMAAGDDYSLPERCEISVNTLKRHPNATAVLLSANIIDANGKIIGERKFSRRKSSEYSQNISDLLSGMHDTFGATRAFRKEIFEKFGSFRNGCPTEDTPLLLRSLICGPNILSQQKGVHYRKHESNLSGWASLARMDIEAIYTQYRDDISTALTNGLTNAEIASSLERWMQLDRKSRRIRLNMASDGRISTNEFLFVLRHPFFRFRDKIKAAIKIIIPLKGNSQ